MCMFMHIAHVHVLVRLHVNLHVCKHVNAHVHCPCPLYNVLYSVHARVQIHFCVCTHSYMNVFVFHVCIHVQCSCSNLYEHVRVHIRVHITNVIHYYYDL